MEKKLHNMQKVSKIGNNNDCQNMKDINYKKVDDKSLN